MKKKGFTLIELIISITLVGVILISMIGTLVRLKQSYNIINEDIEARTYSAVISKVINEHFMKNNGVKSATCTDTACNITLGNNKQMLLELLTTEKQYEYVDDYNGNHTGQRSLQMTTLRYSSVDGDYSYLKTITQIVTDYFDESGNPSGSRSTVGYKFTGINKQFFEYPSVIDPTVNDLFYHITIEMNDPKYNVNLYSTMSIDSNTTATLYTLTYNNNGGSGCTSKRILDGEPMGTLCTPTRTDWTFLGWWTNFNNGVNITQNTTATSDLTVFAKWKPTKISINSADTLIAKLNNISFYKKNAGNAYVAYYYGGAETTGPILVGTTPDSVAYYRSDDPSTTYAYENIVIYKGVQYYISSTIGFLEGDLQNTSNSGIIKLLDGASATDNALELLYLSEY